MKILDRNKIDELERRFRAQLINSLSGFKSINMVGTINSAGQTNLSIVSSVFHLGANPPLMGFIMRPISVTRDTYNNILETGHFTFNHLTSDIYRAAHQTSARYPVEISEFNEVGLTPYFTSDFSAPYVEESPVRIGLIYREKKEIELNGTVLIIGEITEVHLPENHIAEDGFLDIEGAGSITCSGLDSYHTTQKLSRLSYAKPDQELKELP